jgi:hypothetical protein
MAIKGRSYLKTSWAFEERPVASSKLNQWDDRIEAALELAYFLLNQAWGGSDGVIRKATTDDLQVQAKAIPAMSVEVQPGYAFIANLPYVLGATLETAAVTAPVTNPRIDLVQARLTDWDVSILTGAEASSPVAPSPEPDAIALAELYLRPGMTSIQDADDATNGYIIDARQFI